MNNELFKQWLINKGLTEGPVRDALSRCRRIERDLRIDLDQEYRRDQCESVIEKLTYSAADEASGKSAPAGITINGNVRKGLSSLKNAVTNYIEFKR